MKSHLQSYPCPLQINSFWNLGFLLGITIILQIITGIFLGLHYTSDLNSAYSSLFFFIREIYYGWCLRYLHSSGASFVFLFLFLHLGRAISYGSYFYNPNTWFSGIILFFFLMATAFMGYVLPFGQMSFWGATVITNLLSPFPSLIEWVSGCWKSLVISLSVTRICPGFQRKDYCSILGLFSWYLFTLLMLWTVEVCSLESMSFLFKIWIEQIFLEIPSGLPLSYSLTVQHFMARALEEVTSRSWNLEKIVTWNMYHVIVNQERNTRI